MLATIYRDAKCRSSDLTNGVGYVRVAKFGNWEDIVITMLEPWTTGRSRRYDILEIQQEGRLIAWARIKERGKNAKSDIIIVKKYVNPEPEDAAFRWEHSM